MEEGDQDEVYKINLLMNQAKITTAMRRVIAPCMERAQKLGAPAAAMELDDGQLVTGKTSSLLGASAALLLNAIKVLGCIPHNVHLIAPSAIEPIQTCLLYTSHPSGQPFHAACPGKKRLPPMRQPDSAGRDGKRGSKAGLPESALN